MSSLAVTDAMNNTVNATPSYASAYAYDRNGNLESLMRSVPQSGTLVDMDVLTYEYNEDSNGRKINNQLRLVSDAQDDNLFDVDIDSQLTNADPALSDDNYIYDDIGQLIRDEAEGLTIDWRVDGKVKSVTKDNGTIISFTYDGLGNRFSKTVTDANGMAKVTFYQRDAQGNVLAVYNLNEDTNSTPLPIDLELDSGTITTTQEELAVNTIRVAGVDPLTYTVVAPDGDLTLKAGQSIKLKPGFKTELGSNLLAQIETLEAGEEAGFILKEHHLYGSSRLGIENKNIVLIDFENELPEEDDTMFTNYIGDKNYELSNHLGNVLSVITDKKIPILQGGSLAYFTPDVISFNDYFPFGMLLPNRHGAEDDYRYGFQGQEKDDEIKGEGNSLNYTFRMHDPRLGRFFAVDPMTRKYTYLSPYQFASNQPIHAIEFEGLENKEDLNKTLVHTWGDTRAALYFNEEKTENKSPESEYYNSLIFEGTANAMGILLTLDIYTGGNGMRILGVGSSGWAMGDLFLGMQETEKAYEAEAKGDYAAAQKHYNNCAEFSKGAIFEIFGGTVGIALGRLYQSGKAVLQASSRGSDWIEFNLKIGDDIIPIGNSKLKNGTLEMDFNTFPAGDAGKGMGKEMLDDTFKYWGDEIKEVDVTWGMDDLYPNNTSKGLKDAWNYYDSMPNATPEAAVKASSLFNLLKEKGFSTFKVHSFERDMIEVTFGKSN